MIGFILGVWVGVAIGFLVVGFLNAAAEETPNE